MARRYSETAADCGSAAAEEEAAAKDRRRALLVRLLSVVLARKEATRSADRLLAAYGSLDAIGRASKARLATVVGAPAAELLAAHRAAMLGTLRERAVGGPVVGTRQELLDYLRPLMVGDPAESLRVFFLDARRRLVAEEVLARGGAEWIATEPRTVLARALELGAVGLILVHNHPSGDPEPSAADRRFTRALVAGAATLGMRLHDHLVVAREGSRSAVDLAR